MRISLREKINKIAFKAMILVSAIAMLGVWAYWSYHKELCKNDATSALLKDVEGQTRDLALSFLLVEQNRALDLILENISSKEKLLHVKVLKNRDFSSIKKDCVAEKNYFLCLGGAKTSLGILYPIKISSNDFGFLYKEKQLDISFTSGKMASVFLLIFALLIFITLILIAFFNRLTAKDIPRSIDSLVESIESWLSGETLEIRHDSPFSDFHCLSDKLSQVIRTYDKQKNQAIVGKISSGILHDMKNDLQSVLAAYHLVSEQGEGADVKLVANLVKVLQHRLPRLVNTVETTLDVNRDIRLNKHNDNLSKTFQKSFRGFEDILAEKNIATTSSRSDLDLSIVHDRNQMARVFANLIENAVEAVSLNEMGERKIHVSYEKCDQHISIYLEDDGNGIELDQSELFEAFKTSKSHGTGLGLYNAKKIIHAHGGDIQSVTPRKLKGACFKMSFPYQEANNGTT